MRPLDVWLDEELAHATKPLLFMFRKLQGARNAVKKGQEVGDPSLIANALEQIKTVLGDIKPLAEGLQGLATSYDHKSYFEQMFHGEFINACQLTKLPAEGSFPNYFLYPLKVRIEVAKLGFYINKKFYRGLRMSFLVNEIKKTRDNIIRRPFNGKNFLSELANIYDELIEYYSAKNGVKLPDQEVELRNVYRRLTPMRRWKNNYPESFFAFDLHQLLQSKLLYLPDGRRIHLAPAREERKNLVILDSGGGEMRIGLLSFRPSGK